MGEPYRVSYRKGSSPAFYLVVCSFGSTSGAVLATSLVDGVIAIGTLVFGFGSVAAGSISSRIWVSASVMQYVLVVSFQAFWQGSWLPPATWIVIAAFGFVVASSVFPREWLLALVSRLAAVVPLLVLFRFQGLPSFLRCSSLSPSGRWSSSSLRSAVVAGSAVDLLVLGGSSPPLSLVVVPVVAVVASCPSKFSQRRPNCSPLGHERSPVRPSALPFGLGRKFGLWWGVQRAAYEPPSLQVLEMRDGRIRSP